MDQGGPEFRAVRVLASYPIDGPVQRDSRFIRVQALAGLQPGVDVLGDLSRHPVGDRPLAADDVPETGHLQRCGEMDGLVGQVTATRCVAEALKAAAKEGFDVVVSDLGLPDGSGLALMETLRERGLRRGIALSGFGMDDDIRRSLQAGFAAHFVKPVEIEKLLATLQEVAGDAPLP